MSEIQILRQECLAALASYTREAEKTFELFGDMNDGAVPMDRLLSIWAQAQTENETCKRYLIMRQRLFETLNENRPSDAPPPLV